MPMNIYFVIPSFNSGGDEQMRFVFADTPLSAVETASGDVDDFDREFIPVEVEAKRHPENHWRVWQVDAPPKSILPRPIDFDEMPCTYFQADDE